MEFTSPFRYQKVKSMEEVRMLMELCYIKGMCSQKDDQGFPGVVAGGAGVLAPSREISKLQKF